MSIGKHSLRRNTVTSVQQIDKISKLTDQARRLKDFAKYLACLLSIFSFYLPLVVFSPDPLLFQLFCCVY